MAMQQCKGTTKSGTRCRTTIGLVDGLCQAHRDQAEVTSGGPDRTATADAVRGTGRCWCGWGGRVCVMVAAACIIAVALVAARLRPGRGAKS